MLNIHAATIFKAELAQDQTHFNVAGIVVINVMILKNKNGN